MENQNGCKKRRAEEMDHSSFGGYHNGKKFERENKKENNSDLEFFLCQRENFSVITEMINKQGARKNLKLKKEPIIEVINKINEMIITLNRNIEVEKGLGVLEFEKTTELNGNIKPYNLYFDEQHFSETQKERYVLVIHKTGLSDLQLRLKTYVNVKDRRGRYQASLLKDGFEKVIVKENGKRVYDGCERYYIYVDRNLGVLSNSKGNQPSSPKINTNKKAKISNIQTSIHYIKEDEFSEDREIKLIKNKINANKQLQSIIEANIPLHFLAQNKEKIMTMKSMLTTNCSVFCIQQKLILASDSSDVKSKIIKEVGDEVYSLLVDLMEPLDTSFVDKIQKETQKEFSEFFCFSQNFEKNIK